MDLEGLKRRQLGVGGSDAAAVLGVPTARRTSLGVYESKVVPITAPEREDGFGPSFWGRTLESAIADVFLQRHPVEMNAVWIRPDTRHRPGTQLVATPDRLMYHPRVGEPGMGDPVHGLEVKTADRSLAAQWGPSGGDKIPEEYWVQVQHYFMVLPTIVRFDVAVLIGGNDYREYEVKRDDSFCKDLLVAEQAWWERHVVPRLPPEPTSRDIATLKKLYPGTDGREIDLTCLHWHQVLVDSKKAIATAEAVVEAAQAHILFEMGSAAVGRMPGLGRYQRKLIKRAGYTVDPTEYMELRHIKPKGAANGE